MKRTRSLFKGATVAAEHIALITKMYNKAPISGLFNDHQYISFDDEGNTTLKFIPRSEHCHTMRALHGSGYFKLLDDAAFFAAQAKEKENFILTTSFNTCIMRPVQAGTALIAKGTVVSNGKTLKVNS